MRWFFALNEASATFWDYANLAQVAVHSARRHTSLQPVCLYDGTDNALTAWLEQAGVPVIRRRTFLHRWVVDLAPIPRGAYLRLEIPAVCREQGWTDRHALYTDCDVVFLRDPTPDLAALQPAFFAAAPETDPSDFNRFNSGVMWINLPALAAEQAALQATIQAHLAEAIAPPYDQAALQRHFAGRSDPLPLGLNWKTYWGPPGDAAILHFHGPKPAQKYHVLNHRVPDYVQRLVTPAYFEACLLWDQLLAAALAAHPWPREVAAGLADGFDASVATAATGLGDLEPARPESHQPALRWGLPPFTRLEFNACAGRPLRLEAVLQTPLENQAVSVRLNGHPLTHLALPRAHDPVALSLDLPPAEGPQHLELHYARHFAPGGADPRALSVSFRTLRIRELTPAPPSA